ncbi:MAG TPA: dodecin family protein [Xanthobacteraceae bacterium]|nr:dodecin family protein [Xanthobacteraceae bacterium]
MIPEFTSEGAARVCKRRDLGTREDVMAKKQADTVYKIVEVVGVSDKSWEEAGRRAVETAAGSLRDLRVAEVTKMDMRVEDGKVAAFRTRVSLSFKYES